MIQQLCQARDELASSQEAGVHDIRGQPRPETSPENHPTGKKRALVKQPPTNSRKRPAAASRRGIKRAAAQEENQEDINKARREDPLDDMSYTPTSEESDHPTVEMNSDIGDDDELVLEVVDGLNLEIVDAETWLNATSNTREIQLKNLGPKDMQLFDEAIKKEWNTNVEAGAVTVIPPIEAQKIRQQQPHRIMQSRLLHVAKPIDDLNQFDQEKILSCSPSGEPCKAKSRWIARGDKDPDVFTVPSSSPVIHRDTFTMGLQVISSNKWRIHFADFSQAFMQGDSLTREEPLFCEPPDSKLLGLEQGSLIQIRKTVYGLVDAPFRWNQHLDRELQNLGYRPSLLDPCLYLLHTECSDSGTMQLDGVIMLATDDLINGGNEKHQSLMHALHSKYKFGKWEYDSGRFCGKDITQNKDFSISISQQYYSELKCKERLHIPKGLSNETECDSDRIRALREKVGALSWLAKETRVDLAGSVSLLMQCFPKPTIGDMKTCNRILKEASLYSDLGIIVRPIPTNELCVVVSSDAAWANAKNEEGKEERSQAGYVVLATSRKMLDGEDSSFSVVSWKSHTLKRKTVSTLSAETQAIVESTAVACWYRFILAECLYAHLLKDLPKDWEAAIDTLEFGIITDAKSVYDALTKSTGISSTVGDKRTAIDLSIIREYLRRHKGCIRWIDGTLQLADSLTKFMNADFLRSVLHRGKYQLREELSTLQLRHQAKEDRRNRKEMLQQSNKIKENGECDFQDVR